MLRDVYFGRDAKVPEHYEEWIEQIVETRNYFIHNDPRSQSKAASGQQLFNLTMWLRGLVTAVVLHRVGVPLNAIMTAITWRGWSLDLARIR